MARGHTATLKPYQPKWNSGTTQTIRVPIALTDSILEFARKLDNNANHLSQVNDSDTVNSEMANHLSQVISDLKQVYETPRNNFSKEKKALLCSAISQLESLVTSDRE